MKQPDAPFAPHLDPALDRYRRLLAEASAYRGVSLSRDAWRRLRRNRVAMASLAFLVVLSLLAVFTPLLPLEPPRRVQTGLKYSPPSFRPLFVATFTLTEDRLAEARRQAHQLRQQAEQAGRSRQAPPTVDAQPPADDPGAAPANLAARLEDAIQAPYKEAGFGPLNRFNRGLVQLRLKIFGPWTLTSLCGRDDLGRDLASRLFWGARVSLLVGLVAALVSLVIGVSYGSVSGYLGGHADEMMMRLVDVLYSIPFIFIVIFLVTILSDEQIKAVYLDPYGIDRISIFYVVVGAIYWLTMARVVRGQVISLKHDQFVEAARTIGASRARIIFLHVVPNLLSVVIVYLTLTIPSVMLFEAFLSFLGLGVEPPDVSWGLLANEGMKVITPVKTYWWLVVFPGLALGVTLFALNFLGDGLRDALDPRLKNR